MRHAVYISSGASYNTASQVYAENTVLACMTSNSTAAQGVQISNEFSSNILVNCVQADVATDAALSFFGFHRGFVASNNVITGGKGNGIADNGILTGDATNLCEKNTFTGNNVCQVNYTGIEIAGCFNDIFVGNYSFNNSQKSLGTYYGIALTNTPLGGSAVAASPANNRFVGNYSWGAQQGYALADLADHTGMVNEINANYLSAGATGSVLNGNNTLILLGNYTAESYEQQNMQPRFVGSSVRGIAIRNGIANGEQYIGVVAGATPDMYVSNNAGTINHIFKDNGNFVLNRPGTGTTYTGLTSGTTTVDKWREVTLLRGHLNPGVSILD